METTKLLHQTIQFGVKTKNGVVVEVGRSYLYTPQTNKDTKEKTKVS